MSAETPAAQASQHLSFVEKVGYGVGDMASNLYLGVINVYLLYYYVDVWGIDPASAAFMFLITKVIDAVSDPVMGLIADRTRTEMGRYRPYLLWVAVPCALFGYLLFSGPEYSQQGKLIFAYLSYSLVMLAYTAINVPYSALLAVISPSEVERTKATQYRFIFASLGTILVGASTKPLVQWLGGGDEVTGFRLTMALFATLSVLLFWFTFFSTRERVQPAEPEEGGGSIREDLSDLVSNISWVVLAVSGILVVVGLVARISSATFYTKYCMGLGEEKVLWWMDSTSLLVTSGFVGQLLGALLSPTLLQRFDKRALMIIANLLAAASMCASYFIPSDQFGLTLALYTVGIFAFGVIITLLFAMYTDCAEYGEWETGKNNAGLTVSASMFSLKAGSAFGSAIPLTILALFSFNQELAEQSPEALQGIELMFNIVPALFFGLAGLLMLGYKIDRALLKQIELELAERRAQRAEPVET